MERDIFLGLQPFIHRMDDNQLSVLKSNFQPFNILRSGVCTFIIKNIPVLKIENVDIYILTEQCGKSAAGLFLVIDEIYYFINHSLVEELSFPNIKHRYPQLSAYLKFVGICIEITMIPIYAVSLIIETLSSMATAINMSLSSNTLFHVGLLSLKKTSEPNHHMNWTSYIHELNQSMRTSVSPLYSIIDSKKRSMYNSTIDTAYLNRVTSLLSESYLLPAQETDIIETITKHLEVQEAHLLKLIDKICYVQKSDFENISSEVKSNSSMCMCMSGICMEMDAGPSTGEDSTPAHTTKKVLHTFIRFMSICTLYI